MAKSHKKSVSSTGTHNNLRQLKRQAKDLLKAFKANDPKAVASIQEHFDGADPASFKLAQAQLVLARSAGFDSWRDLRATLPAEGPGAHTPQRTRPAGMHPEHYIHCGVKKVNGDQAWALFEACRDGDVNVLLCSE